MTFSLYGSDCSLTPPPVLLTPSVSVETLFTQLDCHLQAYDSVHTVYSAIASESLTFVDTKNVVLFNEYMRQLQHNFGLSPQLVSPVALESMSPISVNYELSLEGWVKSMWEKIKGFFSKIYEAIKAFMTTHLTRLGRLKNKLTNIQGVAKDTDKNIGQAHLDDVPAGLAGKFKGQGDITETALAKMVKSTSEMVADLQAVTLSGQKAATQGILDANFVSEVKKLKESALAAHKQIQDNQAQKDKLGVFKDRKERSQINTDNKTLQQVAKDAQAKADEGDATIVQAGSDVSADQGSDKASQDIYTTYLKTLVDTLSQYKGKTMVSGKTLTKVEVSEDNELLVEFEEEGEIAESILLTNKEGIQSLCTQALEMIEGAEKQTEAFNKTNDTIMKQLQAVDNLIADIDRVQDERYGQYRQVLDKKIRTRLNMMKTLFRSYNQVGKTFFETALLTGDAVVDYCVLSLKHFK